MGRKYKYSTITIIFILSKKGGNLSKNLLSYSSNYSQHILMNKLNVKNKREHPQVSAIANFQATMHSHKILNLLHDLNGRTATVFAIVRWYELTDVVHAFSKGKLFLSNKYMTKYW